MKVMVNVS